MHESISTGNARGRRTRRALLEAGAASFGELGYARTRIVDITDAAGISQGAFYRHFTDKKEMLTAALAEPLDLLAVAIARLRTDPVPPQLAPIAEVHTAFLTAYARDRRVLRVLREAAAMGEPELAELWLDIRRRYLAEIEAWLRELARDGAIAPPPDVVVLAEAFGAVVDQMAYTRIGLATSDLRSATIAKIGHATATMWAGALALGGSDSPSAA